MKLTISIDRNSKSWAVFDDWKAVHQFTKYENEEDALREAKAWVAKRTNEEPGVVYPSIRKMVCHYVSKKKPSRMKLI